MKNIKTILLGFIIGIAAITPGLSGGMLAIVLGVYAPALDAVMTIHRNFKKSVSFLFPLGIGVLAGFAVFSLAMNKLLANYEQTVIYCFIGLIIGSLPSLLKEATKKGVREKYYLLAAVTFAIGISLVLFTTQSSAESSASFVMLMLGGMFISMGILIPGISSSLLMMQFGVLDDLFASIETLNILNLMWVGIGALVFFLATAKLINYAFKKHHGYAHFAALGFLFASLLNAFPGVPSIIDIFFALMGMTGSYMFMKKASDG